MVKIAKFRMLKQDLPESWIWQIIAAAARRGHYIKGILLPDVAVVQFDGIDLLQSCLDSSRVHATHLQTWADIACVLYESLSGYAVSIGMDPSFLTLCILFGKDDDIGRHASFRDLCLLDAFDPSAIVAKAIIPSNYITSKGILLAELTDSETVRTEFLPYDRSEAATSFDGVIAITQKDVNDAVIAHSKSIGHLIESCFSVKVDFLKLEFLSISNRVWLNGVTQISFYQRIPCTNRLISQVPDTALEKLKKVRSLVHRVKSVSLQKSILSRLASMVSN